MNRPPGPMRKGRVARRLRRARREEWLPRWQAVQPTLIVVSVVGVLVLGTIGAHRENPDFSLFDCFYLALSLFTLGGTMDPPLPIELQIARVVAPIITGYAVVKAILVLFRDNLQLVHVGLFARRHVVLAGLGSKGSRLAQALDDANYRVVGVERDLTSPAVAGCRDRGISVLRGDARDHLVLRRAQLARADHMFVACGDDRIDMDVAAAAETLVGGEAENTARLDPLVIFVAVDDLRLWRSLSTERLTTTHRSATRLELFHVHESAARVLVDRYPPFPAREHSHAVFVGIDGIGEALVLQLARLWLAERPDQYARLQVSLLGPAADSDLAYLLSRYPGLVDMCDVHPRASSLQDPDLGDAMAEASRAAGTISSVYVCHSDEGQALAIALALRKLGPVEGTRIVVAVQDQNAGMANALTHALGEQEQLVPFGVLTAALDSELLFGGLNELLARAKHREYLESQQRAGETSASNSSLVPWDELAPRLKTENRRFVDGIPAKLELAGCTVVPSPLADARNGCFQFAAEMVERLARMEHERWMRSQTARRASRPDLFLPWDQLPTHQKEKDRNPVREIPAMLAQAGFEVIPRDEPGSAVPRDPAV
jgi:voltage-gated potassium channel Kch